MSLPDSSLTLSKSKRKLSLRSLLIVPFVLQIFVAVGLTGYISLRNGQKAVNDVASQLRREMSDRLNLQVLNYLEKPYIAGQVIVAAAQEGQLDLTDFTKLERTLWRLVSQNTLEDVQIGFSDGMSIALDTTLNDGIVSRLSDKARLPERRFYKLDAQGQRIALLKTQAEFDPRTRPWYQVVQEAGKPAWTSQPYVSSSYKTATMALSQPIYNSDGTLLGVQKSTFRMLKIHRFLSELKVGQTGQTFIVDRSGNLIASSTISQPYILDLKNEELQQIPAVKSESPVIRATTQAILDQFGSFNAIAQNRQLDFMLANQRQFVQVSALRDERGIDWFSVVVVPESDFMAQINANTRTTILLCLGALVVTTILGLFTSRWITKPILQLQKASQAISSGQLDQTVQVQGISELESLADSFNQMAGQLKTSFVELESRVEERTAELKEAKLVADSANQAKSEFLANMSHELRTPLNGILGYAQILERSKALPDKERHGVNIIHQCGSHLLTLINDVLDLSKIEARKLELHPAPLHFPSFLQGVVEINRIRAEQKGITFELHADPQLPVGVSADEKRLRQVLINLLGNAIKFTDRGSVIFKVELIGAKICFQIQDTGVGMTPQQVKKIFLPFEQVGNTKKQTEGTGLGLAISHKIVSLMQSEIIVQSTLGEGSLFSFAVELPEVEQWAAASRATQQGMIVGYQGKKQKILVIDDRWENRSVLFNLLEPIGFEIIEASNGQEGIEQTLNTVPDLIITDLAMPVMDGFEFLQKLRSHPKLQDQLVIVSSASVFDLDRHKSIDAGGNDFLSKPVQAETLLELTQKHLHLNWIYDSDRTNNQPPIRTPDQIQPPAIDILTQLSELAQIGELDSILDIAQQLQHTNANLAPFVQELIRLANACEIVKLRAFIQHYLANTQEQ